MTKPKDPSWLSAEKVRELLDYDPATGIFTWRVRLRNAAPGKRAGASHRSGAILIKINGRLNQAHRLVWLHVYGIWPTNFIDHIDGDPQNNRIANLRQVTASQNQWNKRTTTGTRGVSWRARRKKWYASIAVNGKSFHLGSFDTEVDAAAAYAAASRRYHGEYGRAQ